MIVNDVVWLHDQDSVARGEPGIEHAYAAALVSVVNAIEGRVDPVWVMGASGFAFRSFVNEVLCPSAMSVFDFNAVLPEAIEQLGYRASYTSRYWDEENLDEERRRTAHEEIVKGIQSGRPAIVWDVADCDWGLAVGYDDQDKTYSTLTNEGKPASLPCERLGHNGIDILSVAIPTEPNGRSREEIIRRSLELAVSHAEGREWTERPKYQNGLDAYGLWATICERGALLAEAGKIGNLGEDIPRFAAYYAAVNCGARFYARDYLATITTDYPAFREAADAYRRVAEHLRPVWDTFRARSLPNTAGFAAAAAALRAAREAESEGVKRLKDSLES